MKIVLFGASDITPVIADFLIGSGHDICAVMTTPPQFKISYNPNGVKNLRHADMHDWAADKNIPVFNYTDGAQALIDIAPFEPDFGLVAGWYHMVPKKLRALFLKGCAGFHASLLPQLRGGAPLNWAILLGHRQTGVSFFELSDGVDDGMLYAQKAFAIEDNDYIGDLVRKSREAMLSILSETLPGIDAGTVQPYPQVGEPTHVPQRTPEDSLIDWTATADDILRLIRASARPYAGAYSFLNGQKIIVWAAQISSASPEGRPGQVIIIEKLPHIICGEGALMITEWDSPMPLQPGNLSRDAAA